MSLFVSNLHPDCTESTLYKKFRSAGKILNIHIARNKESKRSLGFGYINFADKNDAEYVLNSMNYEPVGGQPIRIMWVRPDIKTFNPSANIFVRNLHSSIDEPALRDIFSSYGTILSLKVDCCKNGMSKGLGYVQFENEDSADAAIEGVNNHLIKGLKVGVCKFESIHKRHDSFTNIYLKPLQPEIDDIHLIELCSKYGNILSARVMKNDDGKSKGFGFVSFEKTEEAKTAVEQLNGTQLYGKVLYVGRAMKKSERQAFMWNKFKEKLKNSEIVNF
ncbi:polyadenylate-binding protein 1A-like [Parasteatoda tepidariorum]|uniref:polyadenylate-binding protein 1A-like n=1 Tax=Parasteatoda tepidariorum TaxID=114398 RepID=UPI001C724802|nr:polyadenylate-binding protein 1A-like [Parasteatoda tepidariorum]